MTNIELTIPTRCANCKYLLSTIVDYSEHLQAANEDALEESVDIKLRNIHVSEDGHPVLAAEYDDEIEELHMDVSAKAAASARAMQTLLKLVDLICIGTKDPASTHPQFCRLPESDEKH
ncbi:MAG: hypothetical protein ABIR37_03820 [Candidatus Saccharimonadales bacterium]